MRPALSVLLLTTLIGTGQGLLLVLYVLHGAGRIWALPPGAASLWLPGALLGVLLMVAGLGASFAHLGHPERAWRAASMWRTSWLSREVIALPVCIVLALGWAVLGRLPSAPPSLVDAVAAGGAFATLALFLCTAMIYAGVRFIQEWATPLTVVNLTLLGCASGTTLAAALAAVRAPEFGAPLALAALAFTAAAAIGRGSALLRSARLRRRATIQSAIGVRHPRVRQSSMGHMGGSFNTREFFHGRGGRTLARVRAAFLLLAFAVPALLLLAGLAAGGARWYLLAFAVQFAGVFAERWYFFAEAEHPQNLYYQRVG